MDIRKLLWTPKSQRLLIIIVYRDTIKISCFDNHKPIESRTLSIDHNINGLPRLLFNPSNIYQAFDTFICDQCLYYGIIAFDTPLILYESIVPAHTRLQLSTINCCYQAYPLSSTHAYHVGISHALLYQYQLICARAAISLLSITTTTVAKLTYLYQANPAFDAQDLTIIEQSIEPSKTDYAIINGLKTLASSFNL